MSCARDAASGKPVIAGSAFLIREAEGFDLFCDASAPEHILNKLIVIVDDKKKSITVVQKSFKMFW